MKSICFVVASPITARVFLAEHIAALAGRYKVDLVADMHDPEQLGIIPAHAGVIPIRILRKIALFADLLAFVRLFRLFRKNRYAIVTSVTPKAGMLAMLAATAARIPIRIHIFTGQVWVTRTGLKRMLLKAADKLIARLATHVLTDSPSQRDFMIDEGVVAAKRLRVLGSGGICGIDGERFRPDATRRDAIRRAHGIPTDATVFLFLGRLNRDKGILDLAEAFRALNREDAWLLVVGPDEADMRASMELRLGTACNRTRFVGHTDRPEEYMAAADIFCLPSYREGFGMVIIEAGATEIPAIASQIYGITDAVENNITGLLHPPGDVTRMKDVMTELVTDPERRQALGRAARERALKLFSSARLTGAWLVFYGELLD